MRGDEAALSSRRECDREVLIGRGKRRGSCPYFPEGTNESEPTKGCASEYLQYVTESMSPRILALPRLVRDYAELGRPLFEVWVRNLPTSVIFVTLDGRILRWVFVIDVTSGWLALRKELQSIAILV